MKVDREEFSAALARLKPALASGGSIPAYSHIWFDKKAAYAFDGGFGLRLELETELECGVPGTTLMALLATTALKDVELVPDTSTIKVKLGSSTSKLAVLEASSKVWPFPGKMKKTEPVSLGAEFMEALRKTLFVKASSPSRVEHYGVMLQRRKKDLFLCSADAITLGSTMVRGAGAGFEPERTLFPRGFAEQLVAQAPEGVDLYILEDCLVAVGDGVSFYSNVLDVSEADDLEGLVASQVKEHPEPLALPAGFEAALSRAEILAGREEPVVQLDLEGNSMTLYGDYGLGQVNEKLEFEEGTAPKGRFRAKAGLLRRALPYSESISISKDSLLLRGPEGFVYVVAAR